MNFRSEAPVTREPGYERGQRLYCTNCRSEIEVINPSTVVPDPQVFQCCGLDMVPSTGVSVQLNVEG